MEQERHQHQTINHNNLYIGYIIVHHDIAKLRPVNHLFHIITGTNKAEMSEVFSEPITAFQNYVAH